MKTYEPCTFASAIARWRKLHLAQMLLTMLMIGCVGHDEHRPADVTVEVTKPTSVAETAAGQQIKGEIPFSDLPLALRRRAGQFMAYYLDSPAAPNWKLGSTYFGSTVRPFYRPDVEGPAYFELPVLSNNAPAGFLFVATGRHDFPIINWSDAGPLMSDVLIEISNQTAYRLYKIDTVTFVAEDQAGQQVANFGQMPLKISGMQTAWLDADPELSHVSVSFGNSDDEPPAGADPEKYAMSIERSGPEAWPIKYSGWDSWEQLKAEYADTYTVLLAYLERAAESDWAVEEALQKEGQGIPKGTVLRVALHSPETEVTRNPEAELFATFNRTNESFPLLIIEAKSLGPVDLTLAHPNGETEILTLNVIEPEETRHAGSIHTRPAPIPLNQPIIQYHTWFATIFSEYTTSYYQFPVAGSPCPTGCGPTSWAMLFAYADNRAAAGSTRWALRNGIFRQNGGYGFDAVPPLAPDLMNGTDMGVRNMILEIRRHIQTECFGTTAGTYQDKMWQAAYYLRGRTYTQLQSDWTALYLGTVYLFDVTNTSIQRLETPVIIESLLLNHFPLAYGYTYEQVWVGHGLPFDWHHQYKVNMGWGNTPAANHQWIPASPSLYAGRIYP